MPTKIILASSSLIRQQLFDRLGLAYEVVHPDVDETPLLNEPAEDLVSRLAKAKAKKVALDYPDAIIISCDQVIVVDNIILGKPLTHDNAVSQLKLCSSKKVTSLTGLCVAYPSQNQWLQHTSLYYVYFRELSEGRIQRYLKKDKPYFCAGSIQAEQLGPALFRKMEGDDPSALLGFPLITAIELLEVLNINVL